MFKDILSCRRERFEAQKPLCGAVLNTKGKHEKNIYCDARLCGRHPGFDGLPARILVRDRDSGADGSGCGSGCGSGSGGARSHRGASPRRRPGPSGPSRSSRFNGLGRSLGRDGRDGLDGLDGQARQHRKNGQDRSRRRHRRRHSKVSAPKQCQAGRLGKKASRQQKKSPVKCSGLFSYTWTQAGCRVGR